MKRCLFRHKQNNIVFHQHKNIVKPRFWILSCLHAILYPMHRKAIITSDLHHGITSPVCILSLRNEMLVHNPDIILIAGDTGEPAEDFDKCLSVFSGLSCPVGIVIGNNDLYATAGNHSEDLWVNILPGIVKKHGLIWMEEENIVIGDTAFVGTMAWYDYSSKDPHFPLPDDYFFLNKKKFVSDGKYINWKRKDTEFAAELRDGLLKRLSRAEEDPNIKKVVVVTHVPLFMEQMVGYSSDDRAADAYFGNMTLGKDVMNFSKVTDVISGHTHRPIEKKVGSINVRIVPGDYRKPEFILLEF